MTFSEANWTDDFTEISAPDVVLELPDLVVELGHRLGEPLPDALHLLLPQRLRLLQRNGQL